MNCRKPIRLTEGGSAKLLLQLLDERGMPIDVEGIQAIEATLYDVRSDAVINDRDQQDVLGQNGGQTLSPPAIVAVEQANPIIVRTLTPHYLETDWMVRVDDLIAPTNLNGKAYRVSPVDQHAFVLAGTHGRANPEYGGGGQITSGLFALELSPEDNAVLNRAIPIDEAEEHRLVLEVDYGSGILPHIERIDVIRRR